MLKHVVALIALVFTSPFFNSDPPKKPPDAPKKPFNIHDPEFFRADIPEKMERDLAAIYPYVDWKRVATRIRKMPKGGQIQAAMFAQDFPLEFTFETDVFAALYERKFMPREFDGLTTTETPSVVVVMAYSKDQVPLGLEKGEKCVICDYNRWFAGVPIMLVSNVDSSLKTSRARVTVVAEATNKSGATFKVLRYREYEFQPYSSTKPDVSHKWKLVAHDGMATQVVPKNAVGPYMMWGNQDLREK